jgi:hypothetical protein
MITDHSLLQAALEGLELKRSRIDEQIAQLKRALSGKPSSPKRDDSSPSEASEAAAPKKKQAKKRVMSPEARERIIAAQKARWAKIRGEA